MPDRPTCPRCGAVLVLRVNDVGAYLKCPEGHVRLLGVHRDDREWLADAFGAGKAQAQAPEDARPRAGNPPPGGPAHAEPAHTPPAEPAKRAGRAFLIGG